MNKHLFKFGQQIKKHRIKKGFSQEALAHESDLDRTYIGGVERGERNVSLINIIKIAKALDIPAAKLLNKIEEE